MALLSEVKKNYGTLKNFVNGEWIEPETSKTIDVENPSTGEPIAKMPMSTKEDTKKVIKAANDAWWPWRKIPPVTRARYMFQVKNIWEDHYEEIARIMVQECGKTMDEARGETRRCIENIEVAAGMTSLQMGYNLEDGAASNIDEDATISPLGTFAVLAPFNFPGMIPCWFWPYAVASGNTYIIKPSRQVPLTWNYMIDIIKDVFPPGVLNLVNGSHEVADTLMEEPGIKGISFVGSTPIAKYVYKKCAENGKRVQAQGGAKNSLIVMEDAVMNRTVANMLASFFGCTGQRCLAGANLVPVGQKAYDGVVNKFIEGSKNIKVGYGLDETVNMGPVISAKSKKNILTYIEGALDQGAKMILDGRDIKVPGYENGFYVGPTILGDVAPDMTIAKEEVFGPVVTIVRQETLDDAIEMINSSNFGNAASIYTQNGKWARQFKYELQVGNIGINIGIVAAMAYFPFGGYKDSFFGDLHGQGQDAIKFFTDRKVVITRWL